MHIGFIGTGSMGTILIEAFIESGAVLPAQISVANRTPEKLHALTAKHPDIKASTNINVAQKADILFLCTKPLEYRTVLDEIGEHLTPDKLVLSITSSVGVQQLEAYIPCKVARVIPSITNTALSGASLITFGARLTQTDRTLLLTLLSAISTPIEIEESQTRISSDIVSCGPAFFSFLMQRFIDSAVDHASITEEQATRLMTEMIIGLGRLLEDGRFSLPTLQAKVCVPGGVTGIGLHVLDEETQDVFKHLIEATHNKFNIDVREVQEMFTNQKNSFH
ncbi:MULTISPECIES: late competence protein ComER [Aneurinibacillus]|uniref:Pyrroline-5-carboxylate reductase n=1 Tax=Aneurinibacillus thermoaerophilus TaxID=143495 RepID=A0A1G7Z7Q5_ANETH|nr:MULTISPECIES: late competence protein ComER [Aneurinibacillus]AMA72308.1 competence protein [Aneurinibacillus sp. XH2]MED0674841.1 late competence protein ComER [Aneurinibacillus thermoaerophilus]MED0679791.1 late competence protein ComER [Aneurinibacillus thermoaerophilus]MED0735823.1 late competence protein ComER [Aneurinibacillus thermoaerophilus]MED0758507.1 late competence protein ComER [Aneurinibacillus thermoaerophilus]